MKLNENLAALRKEKGITQEEAAQAFGVTNQAVSKWELGQSCPDISLLPEIAAYYGVSVDSLLGAEPHWMRIASAASDYTKNRDGIRYWEAAKAAFAGMFAAHGGDIEEAEEVMETAELVPGTAFWFMTENAGGLLYPPVMFVYRDETDRDALTERERENSFRFCKCFASERNRKIAAALRWDLPKSAVELSVETGIPAEEVGRAIRDEFENMVREEQLLGCPRFSIQPWVKPLLWLTAYYF